MLKKFLLNYFLAFFNITNDASATRTETSYVEGENSLLVRGCFPSVPAFPYIVITIRSDWLSLAACLVIGMGLGTAVRRTPFIIAVTVRPVFTLPSVIITEVGVSSGTVRSLIIASRLSAITLTAGPVIRAAGPVVILIAAAWTLLIIVTAAGPIIILITSAGSLLVIVTAARTLIIFIAALRPVKRRLSAVLAPFFSFELSLLPLTCFLEGLGENVKILISDCFHFSIPNVSDIPFPTGCLAVKNGKTFQNPYPARTTA